jgi:hypothetical protein
MASTHNSKLQSAHGVKLQKTVLNGADYPETTDNPKELRKEMESVPFHNTPPPRRVDQKEVLSKPLFQP